MKLIDYHKLKKSISITYQQAWKEGNTGFPLVDASIQQNNLDEYSDNSTLSQKEKNPIVDFASNLPIVSDVLGGINFFIDKTKQVLSYLALIYNLPSFFIEGFGLDVGAFKHIINILSAMFLIAVTIIAVRLVK